MPHLCLGLLFGWCDNVVIKVRSTSICFSLLFSVSKKRLEKEQQRKMEGEELKHTEHKFRDTSVVIYEHAVTDDIVPHWANIW